MVAPWLIVAALLAAMSLGVRFERGRTTAADPSSAVPTDAYVVAGIADHLCPWQSCYQTTQLLGGKSRFVLSNAGHIAALVNPPTNPKATFQTADDSIPDAETWLQTARSHPGSWWPDFADWLAERSGQEKEAPTALGTPSFPPLEAAPGTYVFDR